MLNSARLVWLAIVAFNIVVAWPIGEQLALQRWGVACPVSIGTAAAVRQPRGRLWKIDVEYSYCFASSWRSGHAYKRVRVLGTKKEVETMCVALLNNAAGTAWVLPRFPSVVCLDRSVVMADLDLAIMVVGFLDWPVAILLLGRWMVNRCRNHRSCSPHHS